MGYWIKNTPRMSEADMLERLHRAAVKYREYADKSLLFICRENRKMPYYWYEVFFGRRNFMHLVGIRSKNKTAEEFFQVCLDGTVKKGYCTPSGTSVAMYGKISVIEGQLDFRQSKCYKLGEKTTVTKNNDFEFATGNYEGLIGYDRRVSLVEGKAVNIEKPAVPTTLLDRPLSDYCNHPQKIMFVLSKKQGEKVYSNLVYEIKKGLLEKEISCFDDDLAGMMSFG